MSKLSSSSFVRSFSAESPSSSFSDSRVYGAELKEGAAQPPPGRPPPEPPDPASAPGQENDKTDHRLQGHMTPQPATPTIRPPLRSLSLNSPRENIHQSPIKFEFPPYQSISYTKVPTPISSKHPPPRLDSRSQCTSQGSLLPSTPPISLSISVPEVTKPHANSETVLSTTITPFPIMPESNKLELRSEALLIPPSSSVSDVFGQHRDELICSSRSQCQCEFQQYIPPIVDNSLYVQQCMIREKAWKINNKAKAPISIQMQGEDLINGHPIAKCILKKFRCDFKSYRGDIASCRKNPKKVFTAELCTTPKQQLLPYWMDSSIEMLEREFAEQFQQTCHSITWPRESQRDITIPILVAIMYRSAYGVSISLEHFVNSGCRHCCPYSHKVQWTIIMLKEAHDTTCLKLKSRKPETSWEDIVATCNKLNIIYEVYRTEKSQSWLIEYPHFVEINLQPGRLGRIACLYMQIPPFCFAVPLFQADRSRDDTSYHLIKSHFKQVVCEINKELLGERERFFERELELRNKEDLGLIYPYRFDSGAECRHLHITIDTRIKQKYS